MRSNNIVTTLIGNRELFAWRSDKPQFRYICVFLQVERQRHRHFGFNASTVHFAITLCRMAVATREQGARYQDRKECSRAWGKMANINIACIFAWWYGSKSTRFTWSNSHYTTEWFVGNLNIRSEFAGRLP